MIEFMRIEKKENNKISCQLTEMQISLRAIHMLWRSGMRNTGPHALLFKNVMRNTSAFFGGVCEAAARVIPATDTRSGL